MATKKSSTTRSTTSRSRKKATDSGNAADVIAAQEQIQKPNFHADDFDVQVAIRQRAFELFQQRGGTHGFDVQDWLCAEAEIAGSRK